MYFRKNLLAIFVITILFLLGFLLILINASTVIKIFMFVIAILLTSIAINFIVKSREYIGKDKTILIIQSIILIAASIIIILIPNQITRIIIGTLFIVYPFIKLFSVRNKFAQFKADLPLYIIGFVLILSLEAILKIVMIILGSFLILLGMYILVILIKNMNNKNNPNVMANLVLKYFLKKGKIDKWEL